MFRQMQLVGTEKLKTFWIQLDWTIGSLSWQLIWVPPPCCSPWRFAKAQRPAMAKAIASVALGFVTLRHGQGKRPWQRQWAPPWHELHDVRELRGRQHCWRAQLQQSLGWEPVCIPRFQETFAVISILLDLKQPRRSSFMVWFFWSAFPVWNYKVTVYIIFIMLLLQFGMI